MILVAGPYRRDGDDPELIEANVARMTEASLAVFRLESPAGPGGVVRARPDRGGRVDARSATRSSTRSSTRSRSGCSRAVTRACASGAPPRAPTGWSRSPRLGKQVFVADASGERVSSPRSATPYWTAELEAVAGGSAAGRSRGVRLVATIRHGAVLAFALGRVERAVGALEEAERVVVGAAARRDRPRSGSCPTSAIGWAETPSARRW